MDSRQSATSLNIEPEARHRRQGLGITAKIFLSTAGVLLLAIGGAVLWTSKRADALMDESVRRSFAATEQVFANIQEQRFDKLKRLNALVAGDAFFKAVIIETDEATQKDDLGMRRGLLGADLVFATDPQGKLLARTDGGGQRGDDLSAWPLIKNALGGESASAILAQDGKLYHAVALPIGTPGEDLAGVLVSGHLLDDRLAAEMKRITGTEVAFVSMTDGKPALAATTLSGTEAATALIAFALEADGSGSAPRKLAVAREPFLGFLSPLVTPSGERAGSLLVLRSIAAELASAAKLRNSMLAIGAVAMLLAFLVSWLLASRMTGPLRHLLTVADGVTSGNYAAEVPRYGGDEVGALAAAIRAMVRELREKAELEKYVASLASEPGAAATLATNAAASAAAPTVEGRSPSTAATIAASPSSTTSIPAAEPRPGELFAGRYEVLEVIGSGGMGKVYRVRDRELDEIVGLKTIRKDLLGGNREVAERFKQEIKLARKATHKNVLRTFDFGDAGGVQYLTMEYVKGWTLRELIRKQKDVPIGIALRIAKQICTGLYAAHDAGVIHRDVKSQNIIIQPNGELKIMDFGIATPKESTGLTSAGAIVGTPEFIAPEQALGKEADARSDIYSAGMVFYELFTGSLPFRGQAAIEVMMKHVKEVPRPLRALKATVPAELETLVAKMVEKDPVNRFQNFAEVYAALGRVPVPQAAKAA